MTIELLAGFPEHTTHAGRAGFRIGDRFTAEETDLPRNEGIPLMQWRGSKSDFL